MQKTFPTISVSSFKKNDAKLSKVKLSVFSEAISKSIFQKSDHDGERKSSPDQGS
jgi:hypothetical protein